MAFASTAAQLERICCGLRQSRANDCNGREHFAPERWVALRTAGDGTTRLSAKLLPDEAAQVMEALVALCDGLREERGADPAPNLADALVHLAERYAADPHRAALAVPDAAMDVSAGASGARAEERLAPANMNVPAEADLVPVIERSTTPLVSTRADVPAGTPKFPNPSDAANPSIAAKAKSRRRAPAELVIHLERDFLGDVGATLDDGTRVAPETFRRVACDCAIRCTQDEPTTGNIDVGRRTRAISPSLRRAMERRDNGCCFPGCECRRYVHAHHMEHWLHGGETNMDNLVTLCTFHHQLVHEGGWTVARTSDAGDGVVFRDRNGRVWMPRPRRVSLGPAPLVALREATGPLATDVDPAANLGWGGDRPDYCWIVGALSPPAVDPAAG